MRSRLHSRFVMTALAGAWICVAYPTPVQASPPLSKVAVQLGHGAETAAGAPALHLPQRRLDLAPPSMALAAFERPAAAAFPVAPRRGPEGSAYSALPSLGTQSTPARIMSRPEQLVRNFKREGLPLARLFQNENSLVHIGLNPKGKPGLWIVEKLH